MSLRPSGAISIMFSQYGIQIVQTIRSLFTIFFVKVLLTELILIYAFLFSPSNGQLMLALATLVLFDMITGIGASRVAGHPIESRRICKSAVKLAVYGIMVSTMKLTDVALLIPENWLNLEMGMIAFLTATEAVSILENAGRMGYSTPKRILGILESYKKEEPGLDN